MGQKVHPRAFRLNTVHTWDSKWFSRKNVPLQLKQDTGVRAFLKKTLREAGVDRVEIERSGNAVTVTVRSAKPGFIIGRSGTGAEDLKRKIMTKFFQETPKANLKLNIVEVSRPSLSATIVAEQAAQEIEKRMPFRRVMKQIIERVEKSGALGVKVKLSGRLGGAEISRREQLASGKIPLQNLRADIDFGTATAFTLYGTIGVKVWINRGEVFDKSAR